MICFFITNIKNDHFILDMLVCRIHTSRMVGNQWSRIQTSSSQSFCFFKRILYFTGIGNKDLRKICGSFKCTGFYSGHTVRSTYSYLFNFCDPWWKVAMIFYEILLMRESHAIVPERFQIFVAHIAPAIKPIAIRINEIVSPVLFVHFE